MRIAVVLGFLLLVGSASGGSDVSRYQVERGSQLEKELGYEVSVQDKHDEWQSDSRDGIGIEGPAPEYVVKFHATAGGKLKDLFELDLALTDANGTLLHVPLAIRSRYNKENQVDVRFLIKKDVINRAVLTIRCGGPPQGEASYAIRLGEVPVLNLPKKSLPKKSFTEAVAIAEQFLCGQKIDFPTACCFGLSSGITCATNVKPLIGTSRGLLPVTRTSTCGFGRTAPQS